MDKTSTVEFLFNPNISLEVEVLVRDEAILTKRLILEHNVNYRGSKVTMKNDKSANRSVSRDFIVEVSQEEFVEEDLTKNCAI